MPLSISIKNNGKSRPARQNSDVAMTLLPALRCFQRSHWMGTIYKQSFWRRRERSYSPAVHAEWGLRDGRSPIALRRSAAPQRAFSIYIDSIHSLCPRPTSRMRFALLKTRKVKIADHDVSCFGQPFGVGLLLMWRVQRLPGRTVVTVCRRMANARSAAAYFFTAAVLRHISAESPARGAHSWRF
jgi:hypothetical protein